VIRGFFSWLAFLLSFITFLGFIPFSFGDSGFILAVLFLYTIILEEDIWFFAFTLSDHDLNADLLFDSLICFTGWLVDAGWLVHVSFRYLS
jgi:hypothetical protein